VYYLKLNINNARVNSIDASSKKISSTVHKRDFAFEKYKSEVNISHNFGLHIFKAIFKFENWDNGYYSGIFLRKIA